MLPDRILRRHVGAVGWMEQLWPYITLMLIQEKPTVVHRGSQQLTMFHLSFTNHNPHTLLCPEVSLNRSLFTCFILFQCQRIHTFYMQVWNYSVLVFDDGNDCSLTTLDHRYNISVKSFWFSAVTIVKHNRPQWWILPLHPWKTNL